MSSSYSQTVDHLQTALSERIPFCSGITDLSLGEGQIFYKQGTQIGWINLSNASVDQLEALVQACSPATFGLDQRDVLDESYRKAVRMDADNFATKFDLTGSGIIGHIQSQLLNSQKEHKSIKAELYKLNVYGKGSFFKSHKDTPRAQNMFGSLVLVFSTPHEGGTLVLRHKGKEWSFNASEMLQDKPASLAYIAFFGDIDHEVTVVKSGYRVTLTYNLFFEKIKNVSESVKLGLLGTFQEALGQALADSSFLPEGGLLAFGLNFMYPVSSQYPLTNILNNLKGTDADIKLACDSLSLRVRPKAICEDSSQTVMLDDLPDFDDQVEGGLLTALEEMGGEVIYDVGSRGPRDAVPVLWVTPMTSNTQFETAYIHYGNEASLAYLYGNIALIAEVGPPGNRETALMTKKKR